ncbi:MAG: arginine decarboxylase, partial [Phycisphaerales bacterium]
ASGYQPEELHDLKKLLADQYVCNFSVFQSLLDSWARKQLFPVTPLHRLNEKPTVNAILVDITCDSDGKVDNFVDKRIEKKALEVHELRSAAVAQPAPSPANGSVNGAAGSPSASSEPYYLGVFLLGAYQEILGDLHNLLGDTHAVHVSHHAASPDGGANGANWSIDEVIEGDTVKEVLSYVQFDDQDMRRAVRRDIERSIKLGRLTVAEGKSLMAFYESGLDGYTYLEE